MRSIENFSRRCNRALASKASFVAMILLTLTACNQTAIEFEAVFDFKNSSIDTNSIQKISTQAELQNKLNLIDEAIQEINAEALNPQPKTSRALASAPSEYRSAEDRALADRKIAKIVLKLENIDGSYYKGLEPEFAVIEGEQTFPNNGRCSKSDERGRSICYVTALKTGVRKIKITKLSMPGETSDSAKEIDATNLGLVREIKFETDEVSAVAHFPGALPRGVSKAGEYTMIVNAGYTLAVSSTSHRNPYVSSSQGDKIYINAAQGGQ